jgi:hypothetical protein
MAAAAMKLPYSASARMVWSWRGVISGVSGVFMGIYTVFAIINDIRKLLDITSHFVGPSLRQQLGATDGTVGTNAAPERVPPSIPGSPAASGSAASG